MYSIPLAFVSSKFHIATIDNLPYPISLYSIPFASHRVKFHIATINNLSCPIPLYCEFFEFEAFY